MNLGQTVVLLLAVFGFPSSPPFGPAEWTDTLLALVALLALLTMPRQTLTPLFARLARTRTREILTKCVLLVVLGAPMLMELAGLSMTTVTHRDFL